jgi:hypothetical protein
MPPTPQTAPADPSPPPAPQQQQPGRKRKDNAADQATIDAELDRLGI